ncbi:MAG TPA: tetratricopeptide repeat protein [Longimicrobiales bacterium]|nr:tetratricopeptide repeat protein [Longimicrobiales bacterium]
MIASAETAASLQGQFDRAAHIEGTADWDSAAFAYADIYRTALQLGSIADAVIALRGQARACRQAGMLDLAEDLSELSYQIAHCCGHTRDAARALNTTATIRHVQQDLAGAALLYEQALELARDVGDDELIALAAQNIGIIRNMEGEFDRARELYLESIAAALRTGDARGALVAYMHLGMVCSDLETCMEASLYLERALELAERLGDRVLIASVQANRARPLLHLGDLEHAEQALDEAEALIPGDGYPGTRCHIVRRRAALARLRGNLERAEHLALLALEAAIAEQLTLERADVLEELSLIREEQGRRALALAALRESYDMFVAARAHGYAKRVEGRLRELAQPLGSAAQG